MSVAKTKLKQVGLSCTKTGVEIAAKLILLQSDMTINDYVAPLIEARHGRQNFLGITHSIRARAVASGLILYRGTFFDNQGAWSKILRVRFVCY